MARGVMFPVLSAHHALESMVCDTALCRLRLDPDAHCPTLATLSNFLVLRLKPLRGPVSEGLMLTGDWWTIQFIH